MPIAGKLIIVLVLSSCLLLQQVQSHPTNQRNLHNIKKRDLRTNNVFGYRSYRMAYNPSGYARRPLSHPGAVGHRYGGGNMFYLMCTDCGHGRR
uniref:Secreted protein n=1 Tax=Plectus sambesii TaxID=2011161 RepID=A0A914XMQ0_9BILA